VNNYMFVTCILTMNLLRVLTYQILCSSSSLVFLHHWRFGRNVQDVQEEHQICKHELCSWLSNQCFDNENHQTKRKNLMVWMVAPQAVQKRATMAMKTNAGGLK